MLAGCGLGPGKEREGGASIQVTRDFGHSLVSDPARITRVHESDTVLRFLEKTHKVETAFGGGFVDSIDGVKGDKAGQRDWFYYVNGIEPSLGAADFGLSPGDRIQWDYRSWKSTMRVPAIVGAYPEPLLHGYRGRRLPVRLQCESEKSTACAEVTRRLSDEGVVAASAALESQAGKEAVRVLVGRWAALRGLRGAAALERGPKASGVFARFEQGGSALRLLDGDGNPVRLAPPGTGLVAATESEGSGIVWLVTGLDQAGVDRAATQLSEGSLRAAFAVAAEPGATVRLPIRGGGG